MLLPSLIVFETRHSRESGNLHEPGTGTATKFSMYAGTNSLAKICCPCKTLYNTEMKKMQYNIFILNIIQYICDGMI
jgi:hypothetical protein